MQYSEALPTGVNPLGLTFQEARQIVISTSQQLLAKYSSRLNDQNMASSSLLPSSRRNYIYIFVILSLYTLATVINCSIYFLPGLFFSVVIITLVILTDIIMRRRYTHMEHNEVQLELQNIIACFEVEVKNINEYNFETADGSGILSGTTHSGICTTYRNDTWHRLPSLLLCKGDILALMAGDLAPAKVVELIPDIGEGMTGTRRTWRFGSVLLQGEKVLLKPSTMPSDQSRHRVISSDSPELLAISGDIRCFQMLETPILEYLEGILTNKMEKYVGDVSLNKSHISQLYSIIKEQELILLKVLLVLFTICAVIRLVFISQDQQEWALSTVIPLAALLICFTLCPSFYLIIAEVLVTSNFLAMMEADLQIKASEESMQQSTTSPTSSPLAASTLNAPPTKIAANNPMHFNSSSHGRDEEDVTSMDHFDDEDIEMQLEESAAEISSKLTAKRWIHYFVQVLQSRVGVRRTSEVELPIPFVRQRLMEVLGSITFVAFVDDDMICESYSIAEELFLLKNADTATSLGDSSDSSRGMVLDLHANATATGSRFESPSWWKHLLSLKPIGLNALLTYAPTPLSPLSTSPFSFISGRRPSYAKSKSKSKVPISEMEASLISHVRRPIPFESLRELSEEIGFCDVDVCSFTRMLEVNMLVPRLMDRKLLEDTHAWGHDETRRRGTLVPELRGVVAHDASNESLQMMVHGTPTVLLNYCKEYWDGASITSLDEKVKKEVLSVYDRWNLEDFDVIAFSYAPVPPEAQYIIKHNYDNTVRDDSSPQQSTVLFFIDPSTRYLGASEKRRLSASYSIVDRKISPAMLLAAANSRDGSEQMNPLLSRPTTPFSSNSPPPDAIYGRTRSYSDPAKLVSKGFLASLTSSQDLDYYTYKSRPSSSNSLMALNLESPLFRPQVLETSSCSDLNPLLAESSLSSPLKTATNSPLQKSKSMMCLQESVELREQSSSQDPPTSRDRSRTLMSPRPGIARVNSLPMDPIGKRRRREPRSLYSSVFPVMKHQVFLGMAASSVPVRQGVSQLMEDLMDAGIRFIYFSPRNMRRSKPVAAKIGIPFDWNCAISLRELKEDEKDPHRHISSYADWDVHAKMPHGITAIRKHLEEVDNVPLLVSLYTDSTPETIKEVVTVFREYGEVVLLIGSTYRVSNRDIFSVADLACGVGVLPGEHTPVPSSEAAVLRALPANSYTGLCRADMLLVFRLIRLNSPALLQLPTPIASIDHDPTRDRDTLHIHLNSPLDFSTLLEAVRVGRNFVLNVTQAFAALCLCLILLALCPILAFLSPLSLPLYLPFPMVLVFLFVYIPVIILSMLFTHVSAHDTIMKNTPRKRNLIRKPKDEVRFKSYLFMRCFYSAISILIIQWLAIASLYGENTVEHADRLKVFYYAGGVGDTLEMPSKYWLIQDISSATLLLTMISQTSTLLHRGQLFPQLPTLSNCPAYITAVVFVMTTHALLLLVRAALRTHGFVLYIDLHWSAWLSLFLLPVCGIFVGYAVNYFDNKHYRRHLQFLRLEFDTRLGMHSPR